MVHLYQRYHLNLHSIHLIAMSSLMNVMKLGGMHLVVKISFHVGDVIGLTHHSPLSILDEAKEVFCLFWTKPPYLTVVISIWLQETFFFLGGMQTHLKHSSPMVQACQKMNPFFNFMVLSISFSIFSFVVSSLRKNKTDSKHSFSFWACVKMKPNSSIIPPWFKLIKNEPIYK